jgi:purine catabolism regulator
MTAREGTQGTPEGDDLQRQLFEAQAKYQALVENIPAVLYVNLCDETDTTVYVSPQTKAILGIPPESWYGSAAGWDRYVHAEDRERVVEKYESFIRSHREGIDEYRFVRPDGRTIWLEDRISVIRDQDDQPLFIQGVMFDITELKVAQELATGQVALLEKVADISRSFTDLVLKGASLKHILEQLARIAENPVVLEDPAHQLLEFAVHITPVDQVLEEWEQHSRTGHGDEAGGTQVEAMSTPCTWLPIWLREEYWGRVHVLALDSLIEEIDVLALDRAAAAIGLALLSEHDAGSLPIASGAALISDILQGRCSASEFLHRAKGLGVHLEGKLLAATVVELRGLGGAETDRGLSERERYRLQLGMFKEVRAALTDQRYPAISALEGDQALFVLGLPEEEPVRAKLDELGQMIVRRVSERLNGLSVAVGMSGEVPINSLRESLEDASEAARFGARVGGEGVHHFEDLGVQHLLVQLTSSPELARFVESELKPLLEQEATGNATYISTVRAYLDAGGRKTPAADRLRIDRRTLYYRLRQIERLIGRSLEDHDVQLRLEVALRGLDLLRLISARRRSEPFGFAQPADS